MPQPWGRVKLTEVNPHLACVLCHGYFVDATTMAECPHSFCRSCIILYLETKSYCPICEVQIHKTKPHLNLKPDKTLQDIVYKLVPGLFHEEMKRRREFYAKHPNRDLYLSPEARGVGVDRIIYSPEDNISLSLEYYDDDREREEWCAARPGTSAQAIIQQNKPSCSSDRDGLKRYLLCPANVNMGLLKKFIRLKYGLSQACTVEILYRRESLPDSYSLMDIAYIYTWKRNGPIRFYYRIHVPTPLRANLPPLTPSTEPIREPETKKLKSPELLDAVGLRPKPPDSRPMPKLDFDSVVKKEDEETRSVIEENNKEARPTITTAEDTAVSLLLALSNGVGPKVPPELPPAPQSTEENVVKPAATTEASEGPKTVTGNGGFKVPQSLTKRFVFNGGKLVAVKSKSSGGGKTGKPSDKTKVNGKFNGESMVLNDRFTNPLGLTSSGPLGLQSGRLPPGSPRPPPNAEKMLKTKYMSASGLTLNWPNPELTVSKNVHRDNDASSKATAEPSSPSQTKSNSTTQSKATSTGKSPISVANGQPIPHRKEVNRLEQIVQNCLKKEASQKALVGEVKSEKELGVKSEEKQGGTQAEKAGAGEDARAAASICSDHVASDAGRVDNVDSKQAEEETSSILKRKLNDPPFNRRPEVQHNGVSADAKKRRLVTPDVSIELMANPAKQKLHKEKKRKPSDLSTLTERFLHDIKRMKKLDTELKISKIDQMCASTVKIEKVPAPPTQATSIPNSSPGVGERNKAIDCNDFSSEEDQLFIDIRNKCEALKKKKPEPASIAIERVTEVHTTKSSQLSPIKSNDSPVIPVREETPPKSSSTHKKLPRLIEINAPPRPKLPTGVPDPKQKTGVKMTTVRKEVPIGKEGPLVRKDCTGALDLSSGMSPPGAAKNGNKSPFQRPPAIDKSPTPSSLSPIMAMATFPSPDVNRASPIRIPTLKPKSSPNPRPSSLSSSSPSPPAEPRSNADVFPTVAYQQLYRHQIELQSRFLASQVNNNWSRDPLSAKKFEEWMRNVMNLPHHPLMLPSQLSPETGRK